MKEFDGKVLLFGCPIQVKTHGCSHDDKPGLPIPPSVNIFVKVTNGCNARCAFCSNAGAKRVSGFNLDKLRAVIEASLEAGLIVNRLNITGGEPSLVPARVEAILKMMETEAFQNIHVHLNTNGLTREAQSLMKLDRLDSTSVSLHHYDHRALSEIYGMDIPEDALLFEGIDMMRVNASCNLIKGYIDDTEEAHRMMDFCLDKGFTRLGFVGLMPVNDYCRKHLVSLDELHLEDVPHCYFTESKNRGKDCRCSNYLYNKDAKLLDIYMRHYCNPQYCESSLLFDGEHLRQGFHKDNIIY